MRLDELLEATVRLLYSQGYSVEKISYPENPQRRGIDVVASKSNGEALLVKVIEDAAQLGPKDVRELRQCSRLLEASGIIVAERSNGVEIDDIVAIEKSGVYVVNVDGLGAALRNEVYVVHRQGNLYMRVNGEKLREERLRRGYSLGDLASLLNVTRRSVYLYEQEEVDVSLSTALKLMEIFGDEIFKPIPVIARERGREHSYQGQLKPTMQAPRTASGEASRAIRGIIEAGGEAIETKRIPPDIVARINDDKLLILIERRRDKKFEKRVYEAVKVATRVSARIMAVVSSSEYVSEVRAFGEVDVYRNVEEMLRDIGKT
ncbi:transcriptional regulator [Hyperthermus butylicus]|uniref:Putative HTH-type transcriptional regulatory protein Hbut_0033 n=1 Tax=Hyperthermus butylicus (strain DSM 5456 / JCM 9403 / PLM1-5) TaxID=415426 RepID=A2BIV5_HYPBU|nr:helix-turn-helix domain-containing protein [Hyperthermus butylicus]ABM79911.1 transcriptional regulator, HTH-type - conserved archaeal protein [Hyperthermus butylicus DSM 5456]